MLLYSPSFSEYHVVFGFQALMPQKPPPKVVATQRRKEQCTKGVPSPLVRTQDGMWARGGGERVQVASVIGFVFFLLKGSQVLNNFFFHCRSRAKKTGVARSLCQPHKYANDSLFTSSRSFVWYIPNICCNNTTNAAAAVLI